MDGAADACALRTEKRAYPGIDVLRLVCALLVLLMHVVPSLAVVYLPPPGSRLLDGVSVTDLIKSVTAIGVPFFFITSGFFLGTGLHRAEDRTGYFFRWFKRLFLMYCIWTVLTLPVFIYDLSLSKPGIGPLMVVLYVLRAFFLSGSMGIYWYLLSLLCAGVLVFIADGHRVFRIILYVCAVVLFVIGLLYEAGLLPRLLDDFIHVVFGSERNFLNVGLFFMCLGYFMSGRTERLPKLPFLLPLLGVLLVMTVADCFVLRVDLVYPFTAFVLFLIGLVWQPGIKQETALRLRRLSTGIYLLHFPFIILFDFNLERGILLDYAVTLAFCLIVFSLAQLLPKKVKGLVFG